MMYNPKLCILVLYTCLLSEEGMQYLGEQNFLPVLLVAVSSEQYLTYSMYSIKLCGKKKGIIGGKKGGGI